MKSLTERLILTHILFFLIALANMNFHQTINEITINNHNLTRVINLYKPFNKTVVFLLNQTNHVIDCKTHDSQKYLPSTTIMDNLVTDWQEMKSQQIVIEDLNDFNYATKICDDLHKRPDENGLYQKFLQGIYPGTLWCGRGNMANSYNHLGEHKEADGCCREHDHCKDSIKSMESKYGIYNENFYSLSSCKCDDEFFLCLKGNRDTVSDQVGQFFFNLLKVKCFQVERKYVCKKRRLWHCLEPHYKENGQLYYPQIY